MSRTSSVKLELGVMLDRRLETGVRVARRVDQKVEVNQTGGCHSAEELKGDRGQIDIEGERMSE